MRGAQSDRWRWLIAAAAVAMVWAEGTCRRDEATGDGTAGITAPPLRADACPQPPLRV